MKILVTGGAGFIGSHLVDRLIELGHEVAVIDNLVTGREENVNPKATFYFGHAHNTDLARVVREEQPEMIYHLAGQVSVIDSIRSPRLDMTCNIESMINVIECAELNNVRKIVYTSTCAVYGDTLTLPIRETSAICPLSPYAISKYTAELYLRQSGKDYTIYRFGNVYGTRQRGGAISTIMAYGNNDETFTVYGDGSAVRDYIYVGDVVDGLVQAIDHGDGHTVNLATGKPTTVNDLIMLANDVLPERLRVEFKPARDGEIHLSILDIEQAIRILDWQPKTSVLQGMKEMQKMYDTLVE